MAYFIDFFTSKCKIKGRSSCLMQYFRSVKLTLSRHNNVSNKIFYICFTAVWSLVSKLLEKIRFPTQSEKKNKQKKPEKVAEAFISVLFLLCFRARLFIDALWSPAWKGLTSWLSFVMSYCKSVTFLLVFWVVYRFLIFALFLILILKL